MEIVLTVIAWVLQIGITVGIALLLSWFWKKAAQAIRRRKVRLLPRTLIMLLLLCVLLAALTLKPPVYCHEEYRDELTPEIVETVRSVGRGLWSKNIPQVPVCVEITEIREEEEVFFSVHYLYFFNHHFAIQYSHSSDGFDRISQWMN